MFDIPEVPCTIVQPENKLLTMRDADAPLTLEEPTGNPGEQEVSRIPSYKYYCMVCAQLGPAAGLVRSG